jgi:hypothetical protein
LVSPIKGRKQIEGVSEEGAEERIFGYKKKKVAGG